MTLLEALVVVAVTAMVGAIAFPSLGRLLDGAGLRRTAAVLESDLRAARADAVGKGARVEVALAADGHGYGWNGVEKARTSPSLSFGRVAPAPIAFFADGSSSGGGLVVASARGRIAVSVDAATGAVSAAPP